jgi:NAD(P)-dependent dehydrogenase (short-subunit alcohol dehydrogenase family)
MSSLENKVSLVTGGGMGIGRAISLTFAREGAKVVVADFNDENGEETVKMIRDSGGEALFAHADVSDEEQVKAMVAAAVDNYGRLDVACNNAAVARGAGPVHLFDREDFEFTVEMSLTQAWLCMKYEVEAMLASGGGSLVNISSNSSLKGQAFNTPYAAAKGGVNILTKSAAAEYGGKGIRINAVSPGVILTPGVEKYFKEQPKTAEDLKKRSLMNRLGLPQEIAEAVAFLASDRASFITAQILSVDGGGSVV